MNCIGVNLGVNPSELVFSYYNLLSNDAKFILNVDGRASETDLFEIIRSDIDRWLINVAHAHDVIELKIEDVMLAHYRLLIMLVPELGHMYLIL